MTNLLKDIFKEDQLLKRLNAVLLWDEVVDKKIGKHTTAIKLQRGVLFVDAENSVWANELNFFRLEIIEKINNKAGSKIVRDIRFKVGGKR